MMLSAGGSGAGMSARTTATTAITVVAAVTTTTTSAGFPAGPATAATTRTVVWASVLSVPLLTSREPTEKPNTFFSKDKNQIEKFPLSDFFPDYNLL